ncbi:MAG: hypothetical protein KKH98_13950, partial [Spirochaetes bacterium]|nr:hypothetical protein [Spirochaetota bacterium]
MNFILLSILVPIVTGSLLWLIPGKLKKVKGTITLGISLLLFYYTFQIFKLPNAKMVYTSFGNTVISGFLTFNVDHLSKLIVLFIGFFGSMISMYSIKFVENSDKFKGYYTKFLFTLSASLGAVLSDNLITLTLFWGFLGLTLYRFLRGSDKKTTAAAKKSFILIGASDSILILGIGFLWLKTGTLLMSGMSLTLSGTAAVIGFLSLLIASLTKAGAFPVHTWLPDYAEAAPSPISALLPASLDKLLGIYFLARICMNIFILNNWAKMLLLIIGAV